MEIALVELGWSICYALLAHFHHFRVQTQANTTLKVLSFGGERTNVGRYGIAAILQMLETNQSLIQLAICDDASLRSNDVVKIFTSLERNGTLRSLSLKGCKGVEGEVVLQTIMNTLQVSRSILGLKKLIFMEHLCMLLVRQAKFMRNWVRMGVWFCQMICSICH